MENREAYRQEFCRIFKEKVTREGSDRLLNWLSGTDFFTAPASTKYHGACECGLVMHSINVYQVLRGTTRSPLPCARFSTMCARRSFTRFPPEM